jgi:hypothetical protein
LSTTHGVQRRPPPTTTVTVRCRGSRPQLRAPARSLETRLLASQRQAIARTGGAGICLLTDGANGNGGTCGATVSALLTSGLISAYGTLSGVVPDGVAAVTIHIPPTSAPAARSARRSPAATPASASGVRRQRLSAPCRRRIGRSDSPARPRDLAEATHSMSASSWRCDKHSAAGEALHSSRVRRRRPTLAAC